MHGPSVISMIKEFVATSNLVILTKCIIIDGSLLRFLAHLCPCNSSIFKYILPIVCYIFSFLHLLLLNVRSFLSTKMVHSARTLRRSQILEWLLSANNILKVENPMMSIKWFPWSRLSWFCVHDVDDTNSKIPSFASIPPISNLWAMVFGMCTAHVTFIINVCNKFGSPQINHHCIVPNRPDEIPFLFGMHSIPHISPLQFESKCNDAMLLTPCRLYIHLALTYSVGPSSEVWSELGPVPPFPPMRVLEV